MALSIITAFFKAGETIVVRPIPEDCGGGYSMYPVNDPLNNADFVTAKEALEYLDGCDEHYFVSNKGTTLYATKF